MRRSGFTMIELIFVIVIIGILAAVAIPRLAGVQDDALIASEKSGIGAARSSVIAIRGKALARGADFNMTVLDKDKQEHTVTVSIDSNSSGSGNLRLSQYYYPIELSIDASGTPTQTQGLGGNAMAIVLEPDGREKYKTEANSDNSKVYGPATISVSDPNAELHNGMYWEYNSTNGIFTKTGN